MNDSGPWSAEENDGVPVENWCSPFWRIDDQGMMFRPGISPRRTSNNGAGMDPPGLGTQHVGAGVHHLQEYFIKACVLPPPHWSIHGFPPTGFPYHGLPTVAMGAMPP